MGAFSVIWLILGPTSRGVHPARKYPRKSEASASLRQGIGGRFCGVLGFVPAGSAALNTGAERLGDPIVERPADNPGLAQMRPVIVGVPGIIDQAIHPPPKRRCSRSIRLAVGCPARPQQDMSLVAEVIVAVGLGASGRSKAASTRRAAEVLRSAMTSRWSLRLRPAVLPRRAL